MFYQPTNPVCAWLVILMSSFLTINVINSIIEFGFYIEHILDFIISAVFYFLIGTLTILFHKMKLVLTKGWTGQEELVSDKPTKKLISDIIYSLNWKQFNSIRLEKDDQNWIDVSGNVRGDGLAIVYEENGISYVSEEAPKTIEELETSLILYLRGDEQFKKIEFESSDSTEPFHKKSKESELRRVQFEAKRSIEKRNRRVAFFVSLVIIGLGAIILHLWFTDELKFIGHQTDITTATVINTKWKPVRGGYTQIVLYEFEFKKNRYTGYFRGTRFTGKHKVDDLVRVKFAIDNPTISKRIATLKRK